MSNKFKILFLGDIVGRPGRTVVKRFLEEIGQTPIEPSSCAIFDGTCTRAYDFVIANVENASHGFGLTKKNHDELASYGINCMTSGNHIWDKKDVFTYIDESEFLIRPYNYHKTAKGTGYRIYEDRLVVISLLGKTFMQPVNCPFQAIEELSEKIGFNDKIVIVDFHAEATAEKISFAKFAQTFGVDCVLGTHTHVQTADEKILNNMTAYITDAGFCGTFESVIGMDYDASIKRLVTSIPERFDVADGDSAQLNAVEVEFIDNSPTAIKRINLLYKNDSEVES